MPEWYKLPDSDVKDVVADLVHGVRQKLNCPPEHPLEVYRLAKWPRAFHIVCQQCPLDVFVKSFGQDQVGPEERQRRYDIERSNLEGLAHKGLIEGSYPDGSFNIPRLISSLDSPHFALIEEYVGSAALSEVITTSIHSGDSRDLLNALSLLAKFLVTLHERTTTEPVSEGVRSLHDPLRVLDMLVNVGGFGEILTQLYALHSRWAEDDFFKKSLPMSLAHDGLTPVNLLYSSEKRQLTITDLETLHSDTPFADIGTVCAELKLSFMIHADNAYLAEPYIGYFLREYFAHLKQSALTYRQFTWVQAYFMGRRLLIISQGTWIWSSQVKKWCLDEVKNVWGLIEHKIAFISPPFVDAKAVFFDFYNTLVSVEDDESDLRNFEAVRNYLTTTWLHGAQCPPAEELRETYFRVIQEMLDGSREEYPDVDLELVWAETCERLKIGLPPILIHQNNRQRMREIMRVFRRSAVKRFEMFAGAKEAMVALKAHNIRIGIISDAQTAYVESELERLQILPLIDCFLVSAHFRIRKPEMQFFNEGLRGVGARPEEAVFVGDDMFRDIFGAKRVGMRTIYKPSEYGCSFYEGCVPDEVVTDFWKLPELFGIPAKSGCGLGGSPG